MAGAGEGGQSPAPPLPAFGVGGGVFLLSGEGAANEVATSRRAQAGKMPLQRARGKSESQADLPGPPSTLILLLLGNCG